MKQYLRAAIVFLAFFIFTTKFTTELAAGCMAQIDCDETGWNLFLYENMNFEGSDFPVEIEYESIEDAMAAKRDNKKVFFFKLEVDSITLADTFKELSEFPELEHLIISLNSQDDIRIPANIMLLKNLKRLSIEANHRIDFPLSMKKLKKLVYLGIRSDYSQGFPAEICNFYQLKYLKMNRSKIPSVPSCLGKLMNLDFLILRSNDIKTLPGSITNLAYTTVKIGIDPELADNMYEADAIGVYRFTLGSEFKKLLSGEYELALEQYVVNASSGLLVRDSPSLSGKRLAAMPNGLRLASYEVSKNTETIDGITAPWVRIKAVVGDQYIEGWTWSAYLREFTNGDEYQPIKW